MALSNTDLKKLDDVIVKRVTKIIQSETAPINKRLDSLEKGQKRIEKKLDKTSDFLDRQILKSNKRLKRLENHLDLSTPEFD